MKQKDSSKKNNITLLPIKAVGGNIPFSTETIRGSETFSIPGLHGELYAFEVEENSMTPNINHGDMVICREWNQQYDELRKDAAYVIITLDGARVKRLERKYENYEFTQWILKSDNPTIDSMNINVADVSSIFLVVRVLSRYSFNESIENQYFNTSVKLEFRISDDKKEELKHKIGNNNITDAVTELMRITDKSGDLYNELLTLKSRIMKLKLKQISSVLHEGDGNIELNKITKGLLDYIDLLD
jgi:hypothetical protein